MNEQEAYDKSVAGLASQGFVQSKGPDPAPSGGARCLYNGPEGRHCALGWLLVGLDIPEKYNNSAAFELYQLPDVCRRLDGLPKQFISQLQGAHDTARTPDEMRRNLRRFGQDHGLSVPEAVR